jgi:hypothetical protein
VSVSLNASELAKRAHEEGREERGCSNNWQILEFTGHISYPMVILNHLRSLANVKLPDEDLEDTEDGQSDVDSELRVDGPDLPTPGSPRTPDNIANARKYYAH